MQIDEPVLAVLSQLEIVQHETKGLAVISPQLDRKLYLAVNEVLEALGGKWDRKAKAHVFAGANLSERLDGAITSGEVTTSADLGFFETPPALARRLVEMADVREGAWALEPSAGTGRIVEPLLDTGALVVGVEYDQTRAAQLTERYSAGAQIEQADFLLWAANKDPAFDRVVMNPPFRRVGSGDHIDHVTRAFELLTPGGILIAVMPAGVKFRQDRRYAQFRAFVRAYGRIDDLPDDSFKESGTGVRTCVIRMVRR